MEAVSPPEDASSVIAASSVAAGASSAGASSAAGAPQAASTMLATTNRESKASKRLFIILLLQNLTKFDSRIKRVATNRADHARGVGITSFIEIVFIYKESLKTLLDGFLWLV
jgi:hypothetical protein